MIERKTLAVMVDGSVSSEKAFDLALIVYRNSQKFNLIKVIHIFDTDKTYLKDEYKPEFIEKHYKNRLVSQLPADKYEVVSKMKKTNSKRDAFNQAHESNADLIVMGYHGRKGESGKEATLMGSGVKEAQGFSYFPFIVSKMPIPNKDKVSYGVCFDGSSKSQDALAYTSTLLGEQDTITVIYAFHHSKDNHSEEIEKKSLKVLGARKFKLEVLKNCDDVPLAILKFVNEDSKTDFDFVVFGNNGLRAESEHKTFMGKVAESLLTKAHANLLFYPK